ncbi:hypothetical protein [Streptomyces sp. NBC_00989]|uniref:hypothetical protein n=1 Tax=Streptomyces sp. NBC_00989 TaxID=2903705 RepID=UPI00386C7163|nr:hypothetical protein OG714_34680 [Streptomyces sp. NBC_00989]
MNPQSWLDAFVERNAVDLARMREYCEQSLAVAMEAERKKRPVPEGVQGAVVAMEMRDRVLLAAANPVFGSGKFTLVEKPNRSVCLREKRTGHEIRVRKAKEPPMLNAAAYRPPDVHQPPIFDADGDGLDSGLTPVLVWHIDPSDLMADFRAVIVDDLEELNHSPMTVCASTEVPLLATLKDANVATAASAVNDDFDDLVDRRHPREAGGTGDTPTQA